MGEAKKHLPVKLIIGFIFKDQEILSLAKRLVARKFGRIDFESQILAFEHTDYYAQEFGKDLKRVFISFEKLVPPERLPQIKISTNRIEKKLAKGANRTINIDPGYLDSGKLILASTKDYKHRTYLNKGIYAEITLFYQGKTFQSWEWTYPDYRTPQYCAIFNQIRGIYAQQIRSK